MFAKWLLLIVLPLPHFSYIVIFKRRFYCLGRRTKLHSAPSLGWENKENFASGIRQLETFQEDENTNDMVVPIWKVHIKIEYWERCESDWLLVFYLSATVLSRTAFTYALSTRGRQRHFFFMIITLGSALHSFCQLDDLLKIKLGWWAIFWTQTGWSSEDKLAWQIARCSMISLLTHERNPQKFKAETSLTEQNMVDNLLLLTRRLCSSPFQQGCIDSHSTS